MISQLIFLINFLFLLVFLFYLQLQVLHLPLMIISNFLLITWCILKDEFLTSFIFEKISISSSNFAGFLYSILHVLTIIITPSFSKISLLDKPKEYIASDLALSRNFK